MIYFFVDYKRRKNNREEKKKSLRRGDMKYGTKYSNTSTVKHDTIVRIARMMSTNTNACE